VIRNPCGAGSGRGNVETQMASDRKAIFTHLWLRPELALLTASLVLEPRPKLLVGLVQEAGKGVEGTQR
jgi:hypothetical protein